MTFSELSRYALCVSITVSMLAGCGGSQPPIGAPGANQSRVLPDAHGRDLLYVGGGSTNMYTYPKGKYVSTLGVSSGLMCSNAGGDVFIATGYGVAEYPHGSATEIAFINPPFGRAYSCFVDPTTGDLAIYSEGNGSQGVAIYRPERRHRWHAPGVYRFALPQHSCSYDSVGDLFVAGFTSSNGLSLVELPKGGSNFETITLDKKVKPQGDIQWDGGYLAIGDYGNTTIHRFAIKGTQGKQIGLVTLSQAKYLSQFWIQGNIIVGSGDLSKETDFWRYPQGGTPIKRIKAGGTSGVTVSLARH